MCGRRNIKLERSVEQKFEIAESVLTPSDITAFKIASKSMGQQSTQIHADSLNKRSAGNSIDKQKNNKQEGFGRGADLSADGVNSQPESLSVAERIEQIERVEIEVKKRLEQWTLAQRANDFDAYASFYAESGFLGLKRTKKGTQKRFTRKTWLQDRASMFKVGLTVHLRDYRLVSSSANSAEITATQYWQSSSGKYADKGPKAFQLKRRAGRWVITREEMISSRKWDGVVPI
jgi:ketosteroid isomerase-like protein